MTANTGQRLRLRYRKDEVMQYISHLDTLRFALRQFRICSIPVAFGGKFAPKARVNCGPPLPLGVSADNELLDLELAAGAQWQAKDTQAALSRMVRAAWPREFAVGLQVLEAQAAPVSQLAFAGRYHLQFMGGGINRLEAELRAGMDSYRAEPEPKHPCQGILAIATGADKLTITAAATGSAVFSAVRCAAYLADSCLCTVRKIHRECLLDRTGAAL